MTLINELNRIRNAKKDIIDVLINKDVNVPSGITIDGIPALINKLPVKPASATLSENSWKQISQVSSEGNAAGLWSVGDEIDITLNGAYAQTLTLQIADFNHDDLADGSGKAGITFVCKHLMRDVKRLNSEPTNSGGWENTEMYKITLPIILECLPAALKNNIKQVIKTSGLGGGTSSGTENSLNKIFLLSEKEVGLSDFSVAGEGSTYPIFTDNASRVKKISNEVGSARSWWLRSPCKEDLNEFCNIYTDGSSDWSDANTVKGICFGFCV